MLTTCCFEATFRERTRSLYRLSRLQPIREDVGTGSCSEMYQATHRLQHGPRKRTSIAGLSQAEVAACKVSDPRHNVWISPLSPRSRGPPFCWHYPKHLSSSIMATLDTLTTVSRSLFSTPVPVSEPRAITRSIPILVGGFGRQNTGVNTVASPSRVKTLYRACPLLDAG